METKTLRRLGWITLAVIILFSAWAWLSGWSLFWIIVFDFWAFTMLYLASAYLLIRWDDRHHGISERDTAY